MAYTVSVLSKYDDEAMTYQFGSFNDAMDYFNDVVRRMMNEPHYHFEWIGINIGAWGTLVEYDKKNGIKMFREVDATAIQKAMDILQKEG